MEPPFGSAVLSTSYKERLSVLFSEILLLWKMGYYKLPGLSSSRRGGEIPLQRTIHIIKGKYLGRGAELAMDFDNLNSTSWKVREELADTLGALWEQSLFRG